MAQRSAPSASKSAPNAPIIVKQGCLLKLIQFHGFSCSCEIICSSGSMGDYLHRTFGSNVIVDLMGPMRQAGIIRPGKPRVTSELN